MILNAILPVIYQDERAVAVIKPAGMIVHRGWGQDDTTVSDILRDQIIGAPVFAVHRLDRATSGVLLFALDSQAARLFQSQFQNGQAIKTYLALVRGPMKDGVLLDHPVPGRHPGQRVNAVTEFQPLAHVDRWTLVRALPQTGRAHQIRRHLKHLSHPIVGDVKYGKGDINRLFRDQYGLHRLALHALELQVRHPHGNMLTLPAPLTPDLQEPLTRLGIWP